MAKSWKFAKYDLVGVSSSLDYVHVYLSHHQSFALWFLNERKDRRIVQLVGTERTSFSKRERMITTVKSYSLFPGLPCAQIYIPKQTFNARWPLVYRWQTIFNTSPKRVSLKVTTFTPNTRFPYLLGCTDGWVGGSRFILLALSARFSMLSFPFFYVCSFRAFWGLIWMDCFRCSNNFEPLWMRSCRYRPELLFPSLSSLRFSRVCI